MTRAEEYKRNREIYGTGAPTRAQQYEYYKKQKELEEQVTAANERLKNNDISKIGTALSNGQWQPQLFYDAYSSKIKQYRDDYDIVSQYGDVSSKERQEVLSSLDALYNSAQLQKTAFGRYKTKKDYDQAVYDLEQYNTMVNNVKGDKELLDIITRAMNDKPLTEEERKKINDKLRSADVGHTAITNVSPASFRKGEWENPYSDTTWKLRITTEDFQKNKTKPLTNNANGYQLPDRTSLNASEKEMRNAALSGLADKIRSNAGTYYAKEMLDIVEPDFAEYSAKGEKIADPLESGIISQELYANMTEVEDSVYAYKYAKYGKEAADKYLESLVNTLVAREAQNTYETMFEGNTALELLYTIPNGLNNFYQGARRLLTGDTKTSQGEYLGQIIGEDVKDKITIPWFNTELSLGKPLYDLGTTVSQMSPSIAASYLTGGVAKLLGATAEVAGTAGAVAGNVVLGASAAGNSYKDLVDRGMDKNAAYALGIVKGVWEGASEYYLGGIEGLASNKLSRQMFGESLTAAGKGLSRAVMQFFAAGYGSEGLEEVIQSIGESVIEEVATAVYNNVNNKNFKSMGFESLDKLAYEFTLGTLTAAAMGAPGKVANSIRNIKTDVKGFATDYKENKALYKLAEDQAKLIEESKELGGKSESLANKYQKKIDAGKSLSALEATKLTRSNEKILQAKDIDNIKAAVSSYLADLGETSNTENLTNIIVKQLKGKNLSVFERDALNDSKYGKRVLNELNAGLLTSGQVNSALSESIDTKSKKYGDIQSAAAIGELVTAVKKLSLPETAGSRIVNVSPTGVTENIDTGERITLAETPVASIKNGKMTLNLADGTTISSDKVNFANDTQATLYDNVARMNVSVATANAIINEYDGKMKVADYLGGMKAGYKYGMMYPGKSLDWIQSHTDNADFNALSETQQKTAVTMGRINAESSAEQRQKSVESKVAKNKKTAQKSNKTTSKGKVKFENGSSFSRLSETQQKSVAVIGRIAADITHNTVHLYASVEENGKRVLTQDIPSANLVKGDIAPNGFYDNNGDIWIDLNAGEKGEGTMLWTAAHEFTHFLHDNSPADFKKLSDFLMEKYGEKGVDIDSLIQKETDRLVNKEIRNAKNNGETLTYDEAEARLEAKYKAKGTSIFEVAHEEVVANSMMKMLSDTNAVSVMEELKAKDRNLWQKIKDFFAKWQKMIQDAYAKYKFTGAYADAYEAIKDSIDEVMQLFSEGLVNAGENYAQMNLTDTNVKTESLATKDILLHDRYVEPHMDQLQSKYDSENASVSLDTLLERYSKIVDIWRTIGGELNSKFLNDWNNQEYTNRAFTVFKAQQGYKYNIELSSMCKKGIPLFEAIDTIVKKEVVKELNTKTIGKAEKEILYDILKSKGFEIPCAICYVEQARQREGAIIDAFLNGKVEYKKNGTKSMHKLGWNEVLADIEERMEAAGVDYTFPTVDRSIATENYTPAELTMDEETQTAFYDALVEATNAEIERYNREDKPKNKRNLLKDSSPESVKAALSGTLPSNLRIFKVLFQNIDSRFKMDDDILYSSMTTQNLATAHQPLYALFNSQGGVAGYKTKQGTIAYLGDILNKKWTSESTRKEGGIRNQSNSDFMMYTLLDLAQMYIDFSAKGYYLQAYTKVLSELKLFGKSGAKLNASLIPLVYVYKNKDGSVDLEKTRKYAGLDSKMRPIYDDVEGINHEEAFMLIGDKEYSKSITGICIGYSDEHIKVLLDEDPVQMIIGYHDKTDDPAKRYRGAKYAKNYNGVNEAQKIKADGELETVHINFNKYISKAEKMFKQNAAGDYVGRITYKGNEYVADDIPKLAADLYLDFCEEKGYLPAYNIEGIVDHPNYYKLLADYGLKDSEGHYAPHKKVEFDMPDTVPYIKNGNVETMSTEDYIKAELTKEMKVRDDISVALSDDSADGIIPQFVEKVNELHSKQEDTTRYSDREYLDLAKEPEKNEAALTNMVRQAAYDSGLRQVGLHGTPYFGFTEFKKNQSQKLGKDYKSNAFYFTDKYRVAESYSNVKGVTPISSKSGSGNYLVALDIKNPLTVDCNYHFWNAIAFNGKAMTTDNIVDYAKKKGYDGVIFNNVIDSATLTDSTRAEIKKSAELQKKWASTVTAVYDSNQIKSLDPVTYDDNGNVIPLSERFNTENRDIRYSERDSATMTEERIDYLIQDSGAGARTDYAQAWITSINPTDFINLTTKDIQNREVFDKTPGDYGSTVDEYDYIEGLKKETRQTPYLAINYETNQVVGHEGRHRMRALEKNGITSAEIKVEFRDNDGSVIKELNGYGNPLNIIDSLEIFNERGTNQSATIENIIPLNKANRGNIIESYGDNDARIRYSERDYDNPTSSRALLADALLTVAENEKDQAILKSYQDKVKQLNKWQNELANINSQIKDLSFSKGKKDMAKIRELREKANKYVKGINKADKQLFDLESTQALQKVLETEKKNAAKRAAEKQREIQGRRSENRKQTEVRGKIKRLYGKFDRMFRSPTDSSYVPTDLRDAALAVLAAVDIRSGKDNKTQGTLTQLYLKYQALQDNLDPDFVEAYDKELAADILKLQKYFTDTNLYKKVEVDGKKQYVLNSNHLEDIYTIMKSIYGTIMDAKKLIGENEKMTIRESGNKIIDEQTNIANSKRSKLGEAARWLNKNTANIYLNPIRYIDYISNYNSDSELVRLVNALNEGTHKMYDFQMRMNKKLDALVGTKAGQEAYDSAVKDVIDFGWAKMTKMQAAELMLDIERENGIGTNHIGGGGFNITDSKYHDNVDKRRNRATKYIGDNKVAQTTLEMYSDIQEVLREDKWMQEYIEVAKEILRVDTKNALNEASQQLIHRDIAPDDLYIGFVTDNSFVVKEIEAVAYDATITGTGSLKSTVKGANNPLWIEGLDIAVKKAIDTASKYSGLAIPIRNINRALNVFNVESGRSVKESIAQNWGRSPKKSATPKGISFVEQIVSDLQTGREEERWKVYDELRQAFVTAVLAGNLSVTIKQAASLETAFAVLNYRAFPVAWAKFAKTVANYYSIIEEIDEHTDEHWRRRIGLSTDEVASMIQSSGFVADKVNKLPPVLNGYKWIQMVDCWTTATFWGMAKEDVTKAIKDGKYDFEVNSEEYWNEVTKLYEKTIETTQPMYDTLHRSNISKSPFFNKFLMFKTQPIQNAGMLYDATHRLAAARASGDKENINGATRQLVKTIASQTESALTFVTMTALAKAIYGKMKRYKDDDDELTWASFLRRFGLDLASTGTGLVLPVGGTELFSFVEDKLNKKYFGSSLLSQPTLDFVNDYIEVLSKVFANPSISNASKLIIATGDIFGIPSTNITNLVNGFRYNITDIINGDFPQFKAGDTTNRKAAIPKVTNTDIYLEYIYKGDKTGAADMYDSWMEEKMQEIADKREADDFKELSNKELKEAAKKSIKQSIAYKFRDDYREAYHNKDDEAMKQIRYAMRDTGLFGSGGDITETCKKWVQGMKKPQ